MDADDLAAPLAPELMKTKPESDSKTSALESCAYLSIMFCAYVVLVAITILLSIEAAHSTLRPRKGTIVVAGAIHDTLSTTHGHSQLSPWQQSCKNFGGSGLLSRHQSRELYVVRNLITQNKGEVSTLLDQCLAPPRSLSAYLTVPERWSRGFSVDGIEIGAAPGSYTPTHDTRIYIVSNLPTHGAAVFEPPKPILGCPAATRALAALGVSKTTTAYTDDPSSICAQLGTINITAPATLINIDISKGACSNIIATAYGNTYADLYALQLQHNRNAEIQRIFERIRRAALDRMTQFGPRFKAKLETLSLLPSVYTNTPETRAADSTNFTSWFLHVKHEEWLRGWNPETTAPAMMPWSVNAYYDPSKNIVFIPPALMTITPPDTADAFVYATIGFILSHEIAHATDPSGIHFDETGIYRPLPKLPSSYLNFTQCLKDNARTAGLHVNQTLGENYADTVGWAILQDVPHVFDESLELRIVGVGSGHEAGQAAFARMWCSNPDRVAAEEERNYTVIHDPHPPPDFRVNTALRWRGYKACVLPQP